MAEFVTLAQANEHLRADIDLGESPAPPELVDLELKLDQAEAIILDYLEVAGESPAWQPAEGELGNVQSAILIMLAGLWDDRDGTGIGDYLKPDGAIARLLMRLRDPAIA